MANNSGNRKKSNFPGVTSVPSGSFVDVFSDGINQKISYDNFLAGLGVTGTLVQAGNLFAAPVLDTQGTVNNIRNLESGSGVKATISAQNGITLAHSFIFDTTGVPLSNNITALSPVFKSFVAGPGIEIDDTNETITIKSTDAPATNIIDVINTFQASITNDVLICDGVFTVTLPLAANAIKQLVIKAGGASTITLAVLGSDSIESGASPVTTNQAMTLVPTSTGEWRII